MNQPNTIIVGIGTTGFACAEFLQSHEVPFVVFDSRENPPKISDFKKLYPTVPVFLGSFPISNFAKIDRIIISPGISTENPELSKILQAFPQAEAMGDIELFARVVTKPVVAITGSNGKSTVTTLVGEMAKTAGKNVGVGGNLGIPALKLLMGLHDLYVLELSSFQLETTLSLKPRVATVLNICPDHLDRYASVEEYKTAKCRIFNHCKSIVVNRHDPILPQDISYPHSNLETLSAGGAGFPMISFGEDYPKANQYGLIQKGDITWLARGETLLMPSNKLKIVGRHNMMNALAALALGESIQLPLPEMLSALENFKGLSHRCEWVSDYNGITWINDSKGTNVGATFSALQGLANNIAGKWILIAGGLGKNADFSPLKPLVQQHCRAVVLLGEAAEELQALFEPEIFCRRVDSIEEAVRLSNTLAKANDGVLLSPACASWDMFRDFEERGDLFKRNVLDLKK